MTKGEIILWRKLEAAWQLPTEIIKMIIRHLSMRARVHYNRRSRLPRFINPTWPGMRVHMEGGGGLSEFERQIFGLDEFYGPGY